MQARDTFCWIVKEGNTITLFRPASTFDDRPVKTGLEYKMVQGGWAENTWNKVESESIDWDQIADELRAWYPDAEYVCGINY